MAPWPACLLQNTNLPATGCHCSSPRLACISITAATAQGVRCKWCVHMQSKHPPPPVSVVSCVKHVSTHMYSSTTQEHSVTAHKCPSSCTRQPQNRHCCCACGVQRTNQFNVLNTPTKPLIQHHQRHQNILSMCHVCRHQKNMLQTECNSPRNLLLLGSLWHLHNCNTRLIGPTGVTFDSSHLHDALHMHASRAAARSISWQLVALHKS
jgi:hypothetical protein